jgi:hypothetical protein
VEDIIRKLLDKNQATRINISEVLKHAYLAGIDYQNLYQKKIRPTYITRELRARSTSCESND